MVKIMSKALHPMFRMPVFYTAYLGLRSDCRFALAFLASVAPVLWTTIETSEAVLSALMPAYIVFGVIAKDWKTGFVSLALSGLLIVSVHTASCISVAGLVGLLTLISAIGESDFNSVQRNLAFYKRSFLVYFDLVRNHTDAILITNTSTHVLYANVKAQLLLNTMGAKNNTSTSFSDLTNKRGTTAILGFIDACLRGESVESELNFSSCCDSKMHPGFDAYLVKATPVSWEFENCVKFSFVNIYSIGQQRHLLLSQTKAIVGTLSGTVRELEAAYAAQDILKRSDMKMLYGLQLNAVNIHNFQMLQCGAIEQKLTHFSLQHELVDKIESLAPNLLTRDLEISFTYAVDLPRIVVGDAENILHIVKTLIELAAMVSKSKSTIQAVCDLHVTPTQTIYQKNIEVKLALNFVTCQMSSEELNLLFDYDRSCNIQAFLNASEDYGLGVAILPLMLKTIGGKVSDLYIAEGTAPRVYVSFM